MTPAEEIELLKLRKRKIQIQRQRDEAALAGNDQADAPVPEYAPEKVGAGEALLRGGAQGLTLGFIDELEALGRSTLQGKDYDTELERIRVEYRQAEEDQGIVYGVGDYGITAAEALLTGGSSVAVMGAVGLTKVALKKGLAKVATTKGKETSMKKLGKNVAESAKLGAVEGAGRSEGTLAGDTDSKLQVAQDTLLGAGLSGVMRAGTTGVGQGLKKLGREYGAAVGSMAEMSDDQIKTYKGVIKDPERHLKEIGRAHV